MRELDATFARHSRAHSSTVREHAEGGLASPAVPGKRTLTELLPPGPSSRIQRRELSSEGGGAGAPRASLEALFGGHLALRAASAAGGEDLAMRHAAAHGASTPATTLPYLDVIQRSFGRHDVSSVQAHVGPEAATAARALGAQAYATGGHVVLGSGTDLFTVAHEAAHVVQQRGGVQLKGGIGEAGDRHEQHADAVASLVVAGQSAEHLLDAYQPAAGPSGRGADPAVQLRPDKVVEKTIVMTPTTKAELNATKRSRSQQEKVSSPVNALTYTAPIFDPATMFHAGHMIARHLGGEAGDTNLVPMTEQLDSHDYQRDFEDRVDARLMAMNEGDTLKLKVTAKYDDSIATKLVEEIKGALSGEKHRERWMADHVGSVLSTIPESIIAEYDHVSVPFQRPLTFPHFKYNGNEENLLDWVNYMPEMKAQQRRVDRAHTREDKLRAMTPEERRENTLRNKLAYEEKKRRRKEKQTQGGRALQSTSGRLDGLESSDPIETSDTLEPPDRFASSDASEPRGVSEPSDETHVDETPEHFTVLDVKRELGIRQRTTHADAASDLGSARTPRVQQVRPGVLRFASLPGPAATVLKTLAVVALIALIATWFAR